MTQDDVRLAVEAANDYINRVRTLENSPEESRLRVGFEEKILKKGGFSLTKSKTWCIRLLYKEDILLVTEGNDWDSSVKDFLSSLYSFFHTGKLIDLCVYGDPCK